MSGLGKFLVIVFETGDYIEKSNVYSSLEEAQTAAAEMYDAEEYKEQLYIFEIAKVYKPKIEPRWIEEDSQVEFLDQAIFKTSTRRK
jgi:hypothetical protein